MTEPRQIAIVRSWDELHAALRARSDEIGWKRSTLDQLAHVGDGHFSKLLAPTPLKNMGPKSFGAVLTTLGVAIIVIEDEAMLERMRRRAAKHQIDLRRDKKKAASGAMRANRMRAKSRRGNPKLQDPVAAAEHGRMMRARQLAVMSPAARRRSAQKAGRARWAKHRGQKKARRRLQAPPVPHDGDRPGGAR